MKPLEVREIEELLGAYALDAVDDDERAQVEAHLAECPRCRAEVDDHRAVAAFVARAGEAPPAHVWTTIADSLQEPPPALRLSVTPLVADPAGTVADLRSRRRANRRWVIAAAAAVVLVVGLGGLVVSQSRRIDRLNTQMAARQSLDSVIVDAMADRSNQVMTLNSPNGADMSATAVMTPQGTGYLVSTTMPALDESRTYQLWGVEGSQVISLGVLGNAPHVTAFPATGNLTGLVITEEARGGVTASTNPPLLVAQAA